MSTVDPDRACPHENFLATVEVARQTATEDGPVIAYSADVRVRCADCDEPFRWVGVEAGAMPDRPMCSVDETELRAPIRPASDDPDFGIGIPGFAVRFREGATENFTEPDDGVGEVCSICGKGYMLWHAPDPLWQELIGHYGGTRCPRCFNALADQRGIVLVWTPVVTSRAGIPTTNYWGDPIRDRLLVGEPDPGYNDDGKAQVPQGHWGEIATALGWPYETPYPDENRADRMPGVVYKDCGVNAEAVEADRDRETPE